MGMRLSSFLYSFFRRTTGTDDDSSYFTTMSRSYASSLGPTTGTSGSHRGSKPTGGVYPTRHSAPPIPPPKSPLSTTPSLYGTPLAIYRPSPQPAQRPAIVNKSKLKTKVRDFAFQPTDDRYIGLGQTAPKASQFPRLNKKLGGSKRARPTVSPTTGRVEAVPLGDDINDDGAESSDYPSDDEEDDDRPRIQFGPRFGTFFDSDSDDDSDDDDVKPGAGNNKGGGTLGGVRGGAGGRPGFSFRK